MLFDACWDHKDCIFCILYVISVDFHVRVVFCLTKSLDFHVRGSLCVRKLQDFHVEGCSEGFHLIRLFTCERQMV